MRALATFAFALTLGLAASAVSQPLPDTIASSTLTRAQETELQRRLTLLGNRLSTLAGETHLRETAVRNIAVEIFGARPDLDFESYAGLIENGARQLRDYISTARQRTVSDPALAALRESAISAAEEGRLSDARVLYNQLIAANRDARRAARHDEDLADAADVAEAGRLALISTDFPEMARLYGEAADLAPVGTRVRWLYRVMQSNGIASTGMTNPADRADPAAIAEAVQLLNGAAADAPEGWRGLIDELAERSDPLDLELYLLQAGLQATAELYSRPVPATSDPP
ncbi:MAG: hypothetical protein AB7H66_12285 [Hyphomonadaceae bacterium]